MEIRNVIGLIVLIGAFSFFGWKVFRMYRYMMVGKRDGRFEESGRRLVVFLRDVLGQRKLFKDFSPGLQHAMIFWGFLIVSFATLEQFISLAIPNFTFSFFGPVYSAVVTVEDVTYFGVLVAVLYGLYRRGIKKPKRLEGPRKGKIDAALILMLIGVLMISGLTLGGTEAILGGSSGVPSDLPQFESYGVHTFGFLMVASLSALFNCSIYGIYYWHEVAWWVHLLGVLGFLVYLPFSKHFHIVAAAPNVLLGRLLPPGLLKKMNLEDESITEFGVSKLEDFTWKDLLDGYACTECGRCLEYCPTYNTNKALKPKDLIVKLRRHTEEKGEALIQKAACERKKVPLAAIQEKALAKPMIGEVFSTDEIWDCTTCRACVEACPVWIEHVEKIVEMRRSLVLMNGQNPDEATLVFRNLETTSNPWGMDPASRQAWLVEKGIPKFDAEKHEYLYYIGCAGSFDDRNKKVVDAVVKILQAGGIRFGILGSDEKCNGDSARRLGNEYLAQNMMKENIEILNRFGVKKIISSCPHCFNTLKNEYPDFGGTYAVMSHAVLIQQLIHAGRISVREADLGGLTYHDSCYLGRYNGIYESQRDVLRRVNRDGLIELGRNRTKGFCCGAGGGRMWLEEKGDRVNVNRIDEILASGAKTVASACPFCLTMLEDGLKKRDKTETHVVKDVAEIIAESIT